ncbi:MAG: hypothetical protein C0497_07625 [Gemmatimonas sp.]|nr:hypothetical protein [Gemmatimonas sp.]
MRSRSAERRAAVALIVVVLGGGAAAAALFPRAFPILSVDQRLTGPIARQKADSFAVAHDLPRTGTRMAARFTADSKTQIFLDLDGGADTVRAVARGTDHALYRWQVRRFTPGEVRETNVTLAPDGRVIGFRRTLADSEPRPSLGVDSARALAERVREVWLGEPSARWVLVSSSYDTKAASNRIDRTFVFERTGRRLLGAPLRLKVVIGGDLPIEATRSVDVPQTFERRFTEMRAANALLASLSGIGQVALLFACVLALLRFSKDGGIRWRPALVAGGVIGLLVAGAGVNSLPLAWYDYDTATSAATFRLQSIGTVVLEGLLTAVLVGLTLAAAEAATRRAFPSQLDWWQWWKARGTRQVAGQVLGGYAVAAFGLLYVCLFYLMARQLLGWWTPSEMLDDPNQVATRLPWLGGLAISLQAGVWEEAMFRVLPLSLLAIWAKDRPHRTRIMALGVVGTALVFGFAHASYLSWPAYSRGVELFIESSLWAVIVLAFGPLPAMLGHFLYDFVLFSLFAGAGSGLAYRVTTAIAVLIGLAPAAAVAWTVWRNRGLAEATASQSLGAWIQPPREAATPVTTAHRESRLTPRSRTMALVAGVVGILLTMVVPSREPLGPRLTADRATAVRVADSALASRGVVTSGWTALSRVARDTMDALPRFLVREHAESLAQPLASSIHPAAWWVVRYVRPRGTLAERAEEWRVRVWPNGRLLDVRHLLADTAWRDSVGDDQARALARRALASARLDTLRFVEARLAADVKPPNAAGARRKDITITYTDTVRHLPGQALARAWVTMAGNEVTVVRQGLELPEAFRRDDRQRQLTRVMISGALIFGLLGLLLIGVFYVRRYRANVVEDRPLGARRLWIAAGVLALTLGVSLLNELPRALASYDTAVEWRSFLGSTLVFGVISLAMVGVLLGMWLAFDGLRRRVGVPFVRASDTWPDVLRAAVGLAGTFAAIFAALRWARVRAMPMSVGDASLDSALPWLVQVLSLPVDVVMRVVVPALAVFVVLLLARTVAARAGLGLVIVLLVGGTLAAMEADLPALRYPTALGAVAVLSVPAAVLALRHYAAGSAITWFAASILMSLFDATRSMFESATAEERAGAALAWVACGACLVLVRAGTRVGTRRG